MKRFLFIPLFLFFVLTAFTQNFRLGFQASPHMTWMSSTKGEISNSKTLPGIKYGLDADIFLAGYPRYILNTGVFVAHHSFSARYNLDQPFDLNKVTFDEPDRKSVV